MSDLHIYELEDIVWEFGDNDDHIVPYPEDKKGGFSVDSDCNKRPQLYLRCAESTADNRSASDNVLQRNEGTSFNAVKEEKEKMLEKSGGFSDSLDGDSNEKVSCSASEEESTFDHCMRNNNMDPVGNTLSADDPILDDRAASVDNKLYQYQLNSTTHTESDLGFFGNNLDDKESNDLLYYDYEWNDIENFEDVDRMFRSCDSTFGLDMDNNDELGWFPSSHAIEGSDDATKSSFNFSGCGTRGLDSVTDKQEGYGLNKNSLVTDGSERKLAPVNCKGSSQKLDANGHSTVSNTSNVNGFRSVSGIDSKSQLHSPFSKPKHQKATEGKRKDHPSESDASFINFDNLKQVAESNNSLKFQCNFQSDNHHPQEALLNTCVQMPIPLVNSDNSNSSNQVFPSIASSVIKSEDSGVPAISPRECSYASNQIQSVVSTHDGSLQNPSATRNKKRDRQHQRRLSRHPEKGNLLVQSADPDPVRPQKFSDFGEVEGQSEVDGNIGMATELDSSNMQESSCMSSVLDEISIDASSFQQLQDVMEKLDIRTKLCIRDSLYRLARSAERRHKCVNPTSIDKDDFDTSGVLLSDETNKCTGFMDMETDTNPIDRSIAHLLFHRPSDPSATAPLNTLRAKSHTMDQARDHVPLMSEKPACQEETSSANGEATEH